MNGYRILKWSVIGFAGVFVTAFVCGLFIGPLLVVGHLAVGWVFFLARKLPHLDVSLDAVATGAVALTLLLALSHCLLRSFYNQPSDGESPGRVWRFRWTAAVVGVVVLMFTAGISAIGVTHQTSWLLSSKERLFRASIEPSARVYSNNNLKQLGLAMQNRNDDAGSLPLATVLDRNGRAMHGWQTYLLSYIEQENLFKSIDLNKPWNHLDNRQPFQTNVRAYQYPILDPKSDPDGYALSSYAANVGILGGDQPGTLTDFSQGTSKSILAGEVSTNLKPWGSPFNARDLKLGLNQSADGFGGPSKRFTYFVFADGSVRSFSSSTDFEFLKLLGLQDGR